jgi:hypothetical protein
VDIPLQLPAHRPARKILNIQFGKPGCDNKIAYIYTILGYDVINDLFISPTIITGNRRGITGSKTLSRICSFPRWYPYG